MKKIVVLDGYTVSPGDLSWEPLLALGDVKIYDRTSQTDETQVIERIGDAEMVYTKKVPITKNIIDACPNMKFINMLATGYNIIDAAYAKEKGVLVANIPAYGSEAVSQYAIALLLEACDHIGHHSATVHEGKWENCIDWCYWDYPLIELAGKTAGVIGLGKIGRHTAATLGALGMKVLAYDPYPTEEGRAVADYVEFDTLLSHSDVIMLHTPLTPFSKGLINKENIAKMKDGVILINNSRGAIVVEQDLADALNDGKISCAAVDVVSSEPIMHDNPLLKAKNCIITPHISWASLECRERLIEMAVENAKAYIEGRHLNIVNL
ncbi:MAG: D-2-hydroxyacid dehydrogenase [Synergistes sp.]|nr:D-2-hydroxyacid dehydrogenase [Synergistes sp.]